MKHLLFFLVIALSLFAKSQILELYRQNGIETVEKELDKELTKESYWLNIMKDHDTSFGYIEAYNTILVCDKNSSILQVYRFDENGTFVLEKSYQAYTGKNPGDKQYEGDLKTPVGVYTLTQKLQKVDPFYGPMAFVTSYPNLYDRYLGKDGHGIWIHGLPLNQKRDAYTKGCIAINNSGLECLDRNIDISKTILLIFENSQVKKVTKQELAKLAAWLYKWRYAWKYNDLQSYLSNYSKDFRRFDGKDFDAFKAYKKAVFAQQAKKSIVFQNINIIPYPNHENLFQITFYEKYKSRNYSFNGPKELIVFHDGNQTQIITEK